MKVGILGWKGSWHVTALQSALARRGVDAPSFPITQLTARVADRPWLACYGEALEAYDCLIVRSIPGGSLEQIIFRMDALHRLENAHVRIVNSPTTIERTVDKYYTSTLLEDGGLCTPRTIVAERFDDAMAAFRELGGDVVVKPLFGSEGRGMVRVSDPDIAHRVFRALEQGRYVYYVQEFVPHDCRDIRAFVVGTQAVAAILRQGDTWKTNLARGASASPVTLPASLQRRAVEAALVVGAVYAGVDILPTPGGGYSIIEVNGIPGWQGLQAVTGVDVADRLADHLLDSDRGPVANGPREG
jgi:RimK family alpha-L-glutamate ligase